MAIIKTTLFFEDGAQCGWSESYYTNASGISEVGGGDWADNANKYNRLRLARLDVLGRSFRLRYVRMSNEEVRNDSEFNAYTDSEAMGRCQIGNTSINRDEQVFDAVNVRMNTAGGIGRRSLLLRGLPGASIEQNRSISSDFKRQVQDLFGGRLVTDGWGNRRVTLTADQNITQMVTLEDNRSLRITTAAPVAGVVVGSVINVKGVNAVTAYCDGRWKVAKVNGAIIETKPRLRRVINDWPANGPGVVQLCTATLVAITGLQVVNATRKDTGRPSYVPRGRRSVRRN